MDTTQTFYHCSNDAELAEIKNEGLFGGIFAGASPAHHGAHVYEIELDDTDVLDLISRLDYELVAGIIAEETAATCEDDIAAIYDVLDSADASELAEDLWQLLHFADCQDFGFIGWELQRIRGRVAAAAGYKAVECEDEYGISYLVLPGVKISHQRGEA